MDNIYLCVNLYFEVHGGGNGVYAVRRMSKLFHVGIDIGSTTVKVVILDQSKEIIYSSYERHFSDIKKKLQDMLHDAVSPELRLATPNLLPGFPDSTLLHPGYDSFLSRNYKVARNGAKCRGYFLTAPKKSVNPLFCRLWWRYEDSPIQHPGGACQPAQPS